MKTVRLDLSKLSVRQLNDYLHHQLAGESVAWSRDTQSQRDAQYRGRT